MAAPQWGVSKRIFLIRRNFIEKSQISKTSQFGGSDKFIVVINPEYSNYLNETEVMAIEGCFSVPNKNGTVRRFSKIQAKFQSIDVIL